MFVSNSAEETRDFGERLARALPDGAVVALTGELGSGKTTLVQGAARGLGIDPGADKLGETEGVTSPTFVIVREHKGTDGRVLVHVDAYRLRGADELKDIGSADFLGTRGITFIEWADHVEKALPRPYLAVRLRHESETARAIELEGVGDGSADLVAAAARAFSGR